MLPDAKGLTRVNFNVEYLRLLHYLFKDKQLMVLWFFARKNISSRFSSNSEENASENAFSIGNQQNDCMDIITTITRIRRVKCLYLS